MAKEFKMPDIGEGLTEGEIGKWLVQEGDTVKENDPLVEVLTEKVNVEIPSPFSGTVLKILAGEGEVVEVGSAIVVIGEEGESPEEAEPVEAEVEVEAKEEEPPEAREEAEAKPEPEEEKSVTERVLATPAVRRLARELEVDLARVEGTGPRGRVTEEDVRRFAEEGAKPAEAEAPARPEAKEAPERRELVERVPIKGIRRTISEHMHQAVTTAAHFTYVEEVDVTELVALRERMKGWAEERGARLTYLPFVVKALVAAFRDHPTLNATVDWEKDELHVKGYYHIGIATATEPGLVVPVLRDADRKSILEIAKEIEALAEKARKQKLELKDVQDSTFTITSLGAAGGLLATPIVNHPEVAILGVHKIAKRPVVRDGQIVVRDIMNVALSFDHRIIDGHVGAAFTQTLVRHLENPGGLLLAMLESE